jgi:hypothetical protein
MTQEATAVAPDNVKEMMKAKVAAGEKKSLGRKIVESSLYDWNPTARSLLSQIAVMRMDEDSNYPEDAPEKCKADKKDWCWMSQHSLGLRIGSSESTVHRLIKRFRKDGTIFYREWFDDHGTPHAEYKINEKVFDANQRPSQSRGVERPKRSDRDYKAYNNKGAFKNGRDNRRANMDADDE